MNERQTLFNYTMKSEQNLTATMVLCFNSLKKCFIFTILKGEVGCRCIPFSSTALNQIIRYEKKRDFRTSVLKEVNDQFLYVVC